jgi:hypothetical protein
MDVVERATGRTTCSITSTTGMLTVKPLIPEHPRQVLVTTALRLKPRRP